MAGSFRIDANDLFRGLDTLFRKTDDKVRIYAETVAKDFEKYAKENRPWTDRTNQARLRLNGSVEKTKNGYRIVIAHGVDYGINLELAHEKKYAILWPTVRENKAKALNGFRMIIER